jgi:hypothetical protein
MVAYQEWLQRLTAQRAALDVARDDYEQALMSLAHQSLTDATQNVQRTSDAALSGLVRAQALLEALELYRLTR